MSTVYSYVVTSLSGEILDHGIMESRQCADNMIESALEDYLEDMDVGSPSSGSNWHSHAVKVGLLGEVSIVCATVEQD